ncbi:MAG TPA: IPT/TIG domain-containing protein [Chthonomonadaceae bacterium]|nr:IPT/TIG domain-containing protein [Chthonomonadaceae bacterium]
MTCARFPVTAFHRRALPWLAAMITLLAISAARCQAQYSLGKLARISGSDPFAGSTLDHPGQQNGTPSGNSTVEPWVTIDPSNPLNMVATYQQDRWTGSDGGSRGLMEAWSDDGGLTWNPVVVPGIGLTSGGFYERDSDAWNSFAPNGDLYHVSLAFNDTTSGNAVLVSKSTDGGQTWSSPITVAANGGFNDKESVTADPFDYHYIYIVWDVNNLPQFSRTTDAGATWSAHAAQNGSGNTIDHQVVVAPNDTLYDFYNDYSNGDSATFVSSSDRGTTWSAATLAQPFQDRGIYDPTANDAIRDGAGLPPVAVDRTNGNLYIAWMDSRFSGGAIDEIAFSGSTDGGKTWSTPIKINQTPTNIPTGSRQALIPSIAVADDGAICVAYYDFRNTPSGSTQLLTDRWAVFCHPSPATPFGSAGSWGNELRLTASSFDFHLAPYSNQGLMVGDYVSMQASGNRFVDVFGVTDPTYPSIIMARWMEPLAISSLSPSSTPACGPKFKLTVNGNGFVSGSQVVWNGSALTTTFVSSSQLTAIVPAADIASPGTASITVVTPSGAASNAATFTITNPVPVLGTLSPASKTAGSAAFTLTANGKCFLNSSVVSWNGSPLTTTYVSATKLTAAVPASQIATPGTAAVTVVTPGPGGGTSTTKTFLIYSTQVTVTTVSKSRSSTQITITFSLKNRGSDTLSDLTVTSSLLGSARTTSTLPVDLGSVAGGASVQTTFSYPAFGASGQTTTLKVSGVFNSGTPWTASQRITLP